MAEAVAGDTGRNSVCLRNRQEMAWQDIAEVVEWQERQGKREGTSQALEKTKAVGIALMALSSILPRGHFVAKTRLAEA